MAPRRPTLFDLEREYLEILARLDELGEADKLEVGGIDPIEAIDDEIAILAADLIEVEDAIDRKAEGWVRWIRQAQAEAEAARTEAARLAKRGHRLSKLTDRLKANLCEVLIAVRHERVHTPFCDVRVTDSPPSVGDVDMARLPRCFLVVEERADKRAIIDEFKRTGAVPDYAEIVTGRKHLVIR